MHEGAWDPIDAPPSPCSPRRSQSSGSGRRRRPRTAPANGPAAQSAAAPCRTRSPSLPWGGYTGGLPWLPERNRRCARNKAKMLGIGQWGMPTHREGPSDLQDRVVVEFELHLGLLVSVLVSETRLKQGVGRRPRVLGPGGEPAAHAVQHMLRYRGAPETEITVTEARGALQANWGACERRTLQGAAASSPTEETAQCRIQLA